MRLIDGDELKVRFAQTFGNGMMGKIMALFVDEMPTVEVDDGKKGGRFDVPCVNPCDGCNGKNAPLEQSPCWGCEDGSNRPNKKG